MNPGVPPFVVGGRANWTRNAATHDVFGPITYQLGAVTHHVMSDSGVTYHFGCAAHQQGAVTHPLIS